ncbi:MAG: hypothetical protein ACTSRP_25545 [Candidatus Helarchaeota archaeon]
MLKKSYIALILLNLIILNFVIVCYTPINEYFTTQDKQTLLDNNSEDPAFHTNPPDISYLVNATDLSNAYYIFRNSTLYKSDLIWDSIYTNLKDSAGGYNSTLNGQNKKELRINAEVGLALLTGYL